MDTLMFMMAMLLVGILVEPLAKKIHISFTALLVVIGFLGSEIIVWFGLDTGLRHHNFNHLILHIFVPILVFESAFNMNARELVSNLVPVLILAVPAMLLASATTGALLFYGIGYPQAFPIIAALLCGVIVSATDPVAVVALFKQLGAPERLTALLEGESLFNDATAIVIFTLLVSLAANSDQMFSLSAAASSFFTTFTGGVLVGLLVGAAAALLYRSFSGAIYQALISLIAAYSAFYIAEHQFHVSGIVAVLCAGLLLGDAYRKPQTKEKLAEEAWELGAYMCNAWLFLLVGATITLGMFTSHWLAMLIGIVGATLARAINVYALLPGLLKLLPVADVPKNYQSVMQWGGLRGAVSLALALSLPTTIDSWYTIQSITYGVVMFTLFVQTPFMPRLIKKVL